jgi:hypothetical protein
MQLVELDITMKIKLERSFLVILNEVEEYLLTKEDASIDDFVHDSILLKWKQIKTLEDKLKQEDKT